VPDVEKIAGQREELIRAREDRAAAGALLMECDNQIKSKRIEVERAERLKERKELDLSGVIALEEDAIRIRENGVRVRSTLEGFEKRILEKHLHKIEEEVLNCFKLLTRKKSLVERIKVDSVTFETGLFDRRDNELQSDRLSAGEGQLLSVSILWGLAKVSGWALPTVIDTPLGRLDSVHREKLIKLYFPFAGDQVILLSQDEEIDRQVYPWLQDYVSHEYGLEFDDETEATTIRPGYPFGGGK
jgi:DNA sulfur modification protein DndD